VPPSEKRRRGKKPPLLSKKLRNLLLGISEAMMKVSWLSLSPTLSDS
jgi:hypothetical protein